jgi:predicted  nucleic acid-binding Zn-ribbon protein
VVGEITQKQAIVDQPQVGRQLLVEALAYLSVIHQELEKHTPVNTQDTSWIKKAQTEIDEAKTEIQNLLQKDQKLKQLSVDQYADELEQARQEILPTIDWDAVEDLNQG